MRKAYILFLLLSGFCNTILSQTNCNLSIATIDSMIANKRCPTFNTRFRSNVPLKAECEEAILEYTDGKGYLNDVNRDCILKILSELIRNSKTTDLRRKAINASLDRSYGFRLANCFSEAYLWNNEDFDEKAKQHLARFLKSEYTEDEINRYITKFTDISLDKQLLEDEVKFSTNEIEANFEHTKDSIINAAEKRAKVFMTIKTELNSIHIPLIMGWFYWHEMIPVLDSVQNKQHDDASKMALARLGVKKYNKYFLAQQEITLRTALYIGTQKMIAKYGQNLSSKKERWYLSGDSPDCGPIPIAYNTIIDLQKSFKNFPRLIDKDDYILLPKELKQISPKVIKDAKKWMKKNNGKYIIIDPLFIKQP